MDANILRLRYLRCKNWNQVVACRQWYECFTGRQSSCNRTDDCRIGPLDVGVDFHSLGETSGVIHVDHHINNRGWWGFENRIRTGVFDLYGKRCTCSFGIDWRVEDQRVWSMISDCGIRHLDFSCSIKHILETHEAGSGSRKSEGHSLGAVRCLSGCEVCLKWLRVDSNFNS
jgi:hypothetical protein